MIEIREAERPTCGTGDPVHDAEVDFLAMLASGANPLSRNGRGPFALHRSRDRQAGKKRALRSGHVEHTPKGWFLTAAGRTFLALRRAQDDAGTGGIHG